MRIFYAVMTLAVSLMLIAGSSGNFKVYGGDREAFLHISDNGSSYIAFSCPKGSYFVNYGDSIHVITVKNNLDEGIEVYINSDGDIQFNNPTTLFSGESMAINGTFTGGEGEHSMSITVYAVWANGSATVEGCSITVSNQGVELEKFLIAGNESVKTNEKMFWTFRISLTNHGVLENFTVKDTIPAEFEVVSVETSAGSYTLKQSGNGEMGVTKLTWVVETDKTEYIDVNVSTKLNPAGKQEFTSSGLHYLNSGAKLSKHEVVSNGIIINVFEGD